MDPLVERGAPGLHLQTAAEERAALDQREWQARQVRNRRALQRQVAEAEIQRIEQLLLPFSAPLLEAMEAERAAAVDELAQDDAQATDSRLYGAARLAVARHRAELIERVRQIDCGAGPMSEGDLASRIKRRGATLDSRSLPALRRQVTTLLERRDELRRELEVMTG